MRLSYKHNQKESFVTFLYIFVVGDVSSTQIVATMDTRNATNSHKNTMSLREPRKKRRVRLRPRKPFPINIGSDNEWTVYTGHLSNLGVCITDPYESQALHSMGFFGKGSLSRSYPNFEKTRGGVPLVVRQRQWIRRQTWLEQAKHLDAQAFVDDSDHEEWENVGQLDCEEKINQEEPNSGEEKKTQSENGATERKENVSECGVEGAETVEQNLDETIVPPEKRFKCTASEMKESSEIIIDKKNGSNNVSEENQGDDDVVISEVEDEKLNPNPIKIIKAKLHESNKTNEKSLDVKVDEVLLDSSEEEDEICEISNIETTESTTANDSCDKDIILLNNEKMSINLEEKSCDETKDTNTEDDIILQEREILVLPDSDSDVEDYLSKVKPTIEKEGFPIRETMHLTFEETFFLMFGLGCLQIVDFDGNLLSISDAWNYFCLTQNDFVQKYVVYHYFRSKGWVVKPGLKYGGDFLLYKQGPPFYHASYIVIVEVLAADTFIRDEKKTTRKMTWKKLFGLDRLSETAAKEILFAQVLWPSKIPRSEIPSTPELLAEFTVKELLFRRWIPKQNREEIDLEDDNDFK